MSRDPQTTVAIPIDKVDPTKIQVSKLKEKETVWREKNGNRMSRVKKFFNVSYEGRELVLLFNNVRTNNGIKIMQRQKFTSAFMSVNLDDEVSAQVKNVVDEAILQQLFERKDEIMPPEKVNNITSKEVMWILYKGLVTKGNKKEELGADGNVEFWPDQITATVPTSRRRESDGDNPVTIDRSLLVVEDMDGNPLEASQIGRGTLQEAVLEVEELVITNGIVKARCRFRLLVSPTKQVSKITTKRRLEYEKKRTQFEPVDEGYMPPPRSVKRTLPSVPENNTEAGDGVKRLKTGGAGEGAAEKKDTSGSEKKTD